MITISADQAIVARFNALRAELADRAYELERQGRCDAADVTNELSHRLAEFAGLFDAAPAHSSRTPEPDFS